MPTKLERLQQQESMIKERIRAEKARQAKADRHGAAVAHEAIGRLVARALPGGDWRLLDFDSFASLLDRESQNGSLGACCVDPAPSTEEALKSLRAWEKGRKAKGKEEAARNGDPMPSPTIDKADAT